MAGTFAASSRGRLLGRFGRFGSRVLSLVLAIRRRAPRPYARGPDRLGCLRVGYTRRSQPGLRAVLA